MRIGKEKHEKILTETIQGLEKDGYNLIRLDGKSPTAIAIKDNISYAISVFSDANKPKTIIYLEDWYHMFDKIIRVIYPSLEGRTIAINRLLEVYEEKGFRIILLANKSPDAIAYKNNNIYAVEVLGFNKGHLGKKTIRDKESIYDMFDGLMIKTFNYDSDDVFTETYGRNEHKIDKPIKDLEKVRN